jgi:hypothetical protein
MSREVVVRLASFIAVSLAMAAWETAAPRRRFGWPKRGNVGEAGRPDFYFGDGNLIVFLQNLMRKPLSVSWECPGTCGGSGEGVHGLPGGFQPHAISSSGGNPLWRK